MKKQRIIEMHSHLLPGMDDGSKSPEMSVAMLQAMANHGVDTVCATSHYYAEENSIDAFIVRRQAAIQRLQKILPENAPRILPAAEVAYFPRISESRKLPALCIANTRTLMLEMPFCEWNDFQIEEINALVLDFRLDVVLVHPERFCFSKKNREWLECLTEMPIALQVNAGSLLRWHTRRQALALLQMTERPLLGSDCHNMTTRPPNLWEGRNVIKKKLGSRFLAEMDETAAMLTQSHFEP